MITRMSAAEIKDAALAGKIRIAVVGLGQVGLPAALYFARAGCSVIGVDVDEHRVKEMKKGVCPINTPAVVEMFGQLYNSGKMEFMSDTAQAVKESQVQIFCLPTPLRSDTKMPDIDAITTAANAVGKAMQKCGLIILESSVYPGVTTTVLKPALEKASGMKAGVDFGLAYCFERIDPGNASHRIDNTPKVVGGVTPESAKAAAAIYSLIVKAQIVEVSSCETAELVKLTENIFRDINIAFINDIAILCSKLGVDVLEVLEAASTKWSFTPHIPGAGVGGTCIPVNPYYLMKCARDVGVILGTVEQARKTNEAMPHYMAHLVEEALGEIGTSINKAKICVMGTAYKPDIDDRRGSPGEDVAFVLQKLGAQVVCYDPVVSSAASGLTFERSLDKAVKDADCLVITTDHTAFKSLDLKAIAKLAHKPFAVVDGKHVLVPRDVKALGITYRGLGRSANSEKNIWNLKLRG